MDTDLLALVLPKLREVSKYYEKFSIDTFDASTYTTHAALWKRLGECLRYQKRMVKNIQGSTQSAADSVSFKASPTFPKVKHNMKLSPVPVGVITR